MKKKNKIIIILFIILVIIGISIFGVYKTFNKYATKLGGNNSLDLENYNTAVEIDCDANFILLLNNDLVVSNILYLNDQSVDSLYNKGIEKKVLNEAIQSIMENLNNKSLFTNTNFITITSYGDFSSFDNMINLINDKLTEYGVNKKVIINNKTLKTKITELDLVYKNDDKKDLKTLYYYSLDVISKYQKVAKNNQNLNIQNINDYALNLYNKLLIYGKNIQTQAVDDKNGIDITTINATEDYDNELYATKGSWYYIENGLVYAYINFEYDDKNYEYCFMGNSSYTEGRCN